jgi:2-(1,2-epoxy-1,2-dihydrophenyl)acetyl-CoA isomerase
MGTEAAPHPKNPADGDLLYDVRESIATITFNRPHKANAIPPDWPLRILALVRKADRDERVRCIFFRANGKHFMAGGDIDHHEEYDGFTDSDQGNARIVDEIEEYNQLIFALTETRAPIVVAAQGAVVGASVGLIAAADLVVAADTAFFMVPHVRHAGSNDGLVTYFLPRQIGFKKTMEMTLLGRRYSAEEGARMGLINFVVPEAKLAEEGRALAEEIARGPTAAYGLIKSSVHASLHNSMHEQARLEARNYAIISRTRDWQEGSRAFVEKRNPEFKGA